MVQYLQTNQRDARINKMKDKRYMIISIDAEKAFDQNSTFIYDKNLNNLAIEAVYLNTVKAIA